VQFVVGLVAQLYLNQKREKMRDNPTWWWQAERQSEMLRDAQVDRSQPNHRLCFSAEGMLHIFRSSSHS
jgi:hypothetical protein